MGRYRWMQGTRQGHNNLSAAFCQIATRAKAIFRVPDKYSTRLRSDVVLADLSYRAWIWRWEVAVTSRLLCPESRRLWRLLCPQLLCDAASHSATLLGYPFLASALSAALVQAGQLSRTTLDAFAQIYYSVHIKICTTRHTSPTVIGLGLPARLIKSHRNRSFLQG